MIKALALSLLLLPLAAGAQNLAFNHSGFMLDANDAPVSSTGLSMTFTLTNTRNPGDLAERIVWKSDACTVKVNRGFYALALGRDCNGATPLARTHLPFDEARFLEVAIDGTPLLPRLLLDPVPFATMARTSVDAQELQANLRTAGTLNADGNPVQWSKLSGVPEGLADGTDADTTYAAKDGGGLLLEGAAFAIGAGAVTNAMLQNAAVTVTAGAGLSGGGSAALGESTTIELPTMSTLTPGVYSHPQLTVDAHGRITSASTQTVTTGTVTSIVAGAGLSGGTITNAGTVAVANAGIVPAMLAADAGSLVKVSNDALSIGTASLLQTNGRIAVGGPDPYVMSRVDNLHLVLSGGTGWVNTGGTLTLRGVGASTNPGGMEMRGASGAVRSLVIDNLNTTIQKDLTVNGALVSQSLVGAYGYQEFTTDLVANSSTTTNQTYTLLDMRCSGHWGSYYVEIELVTSYYRPNVRRYEYFCGNGNHTTGGTLVDKGASSAVPLDLLASIALTNVVDTGKDNGGIRMYDSKLRVTQLPYVQTYARVRTYGALASYKAGKAFSDTEPYAVWPTWTK